MRVLLALLLFLFASFPQVMAQHPSASAAAKMREAAERLLSALPQSARAAVQKDFDDRDRFDWHYTPRSRNGVALKELDAKGREAVHALLREALSSVGYRKLVNILELELVLRELETFGLMRDPERYHLTVYGKPDRKAAWGWRFEGHHLSLNFTLAGESVAVDTPSFFGANPATVPKGAKKGLRVLGSEEDEARALLSMLGEEQRREAVFDTRTYGDIVTTNAEKAEPPAPAGIAAAKLDDKQKAQLLKLIDVYASSFEPGLAQARMARVREGGADTIRFGWAGALERGKQHYYRIQGKLFLIEYDASQGDGNHVHTVWRDFNGDFGRDLLRMHYEAAKGTPHKH